MQFAFLILATAVGDLELTWLLHHHAIDGGAWMITPLFTTTET